VRLLGMFVRLIRLDLALGVIVLIVRVGGPQMRVGRGLMMAGGGLMGGDGGVLLGVRH
jgi:hypothetical protein